MMCPNLILLFVVCLWTREINTAPAHPVILIPGDGGCQLKVKLDKTDAPHWWCRKSTSGKYETIWVNLKDFTPGFTECFVENMILTYDNQTRTTRMPEGVDIRPYDLGDTTSLEWLDPSTVSHYLSPLSYFYPIVQDLVNVGYERNVSIRGAPFDFRRAPNEMMEYYKGLQKLIEDTYMLNNNTKCVVVVHSMGNPVFLFFLNHMPQAWKDKYIQSFISLSGVWAGTVKSLRLFTSGDNLGIATVSPSTVRPEQRSAPSAAFLMPTSMLWASDEVLIITEKRNYTVNDFYDLFKDVGFLDGWEMYVDTRDLIRELTPPGVPLHCLHGSQLETPGTLIFGKGEFPDTYPGMISDDGDGTVNIRSLQACTRWKGKQPYPVLHKVLPNAEHNKLLSDNRARSYVVQVALGKL